MTHFLFIMLAVGAAMLAPVTMPILGLLWLLYVLK